MRNIARSLALAASLSIAAGAFAVPSKPAERFRDHKPSIIKIVLRLLGVSTTEGPSIPIP